jgi:hypothetical protein
MSISKVCADGQEKILREIVYAKLTEFKSQTLPTI